MFEDVERVLNALPRLNIGRFDAGTPVPRAKTVKPLIDYNGFSGHARMRTWDVACWLMDAGKMPAPETCDLCDGPATQFHAENYFDFSSYVPVCKSCHMKVHNRLRFPNAWERNKSQFGKPAGHWVNEILPREIPVAQWCEANAIVEPTFADFVED